MTKEVSFEAGRMNFDQNTKKVTADPRKGKVLVCHVTPYNPGLSKRKTLQMDRSRLSKGRTRPHYVPRRCQFQASQGQNLPSRLSDL